MKKERTIIIEILWGLPGSGKTTYANNEVEKDKDDFLTTTYMINVDHIYEQLKKWNSLSKKNIIAAIISEFNVMIFNHSSGERMIIDSLVTTNRVCRENLLEPLTDHLMGNNIYPKFIVHFWERDIETLTFNDKYRRDLGSENLIKDAKYEEPSEELCKKYDIKVIRHKVVSKGDYGLWRDKYKLGEKIVSEEWVTGGREGGNCWGDSANHRIDPEERSSSFIELENLLKKAVPNLSFSDFSEINKNLVKIKTDEVHEYYGNHKTKDHFEILAKDLYNFLNGKKLIELEEKKARKVALEI